VGLAPDARLGALPLGVERVEVLVKALLGRLPRVDRAAVRLARDGLRLPRASRLEHAAFFGNLKNRKPFTCEPVAAFAMADSDPQRSPRNSKPWSAR
jgi:hypothetical protein